MNNTPHIEIHIVNLERGVPAEAFGAFLLAVDTLMLAIGERVVPPLTHTMLVQPETPVPPELQGRVLALAVELRSSEATP